jgi:hypothetical protein
MLLAKMFLSSCYNSKNGLTVTTEATQAIAWKCQCPQRVCGKMSEPVIVGSRIMLYKVSVLVAELQ